MNSTIHKLLYVLVIESSCNRPNIKKILITVINGFCSDVKSIICDLISIYNLRKYIE